MPYQLTAWSVQSSSDPWIACGVFRFGATPIQTRGESRLCSDGCPWVLPGVRTLPATKRLSGAFSGDGSNGSCMLNCGHWGWRRATTCYDWYPTPNIGFYS
jgi:hypothetical protein